MLSGISRMKDIPSVISPRQLKNLAGQDDQIAIDGGHGR
jgi:hypothetical protein